MGISGPILEAIEALGFQQPMPIQEQVIPLLLEKKTDLIALAPTGTGKTAAFGLPLIQLVEFAQRHTQALILAPTRELALQIATDLKHFAQHIPQLSIVAVYGGADMERQIRALKRGAHVIVATPGRMNDLLNRRKKIDLDQLKWVVLDEADEMLNMGFKEELDAILAETPDAKCTLLFSATMPNDVLKIAETNMRDPIHITIGQKNVGAEHVNHVCYTVRSKDRYPALKRIIDFHPDLYGIVFCRTRLETKEVAEKLVRDGYNADALHGDLSQAQRDAIMHKFRIKNLQMLVATDVAARGLDMQGLTHIINYNLPDEDVVYTHRSGRTGRVGRKGTSIVLVNLKEKYKIRKIENALKKKFDMKPVPGGREICERQLLNLVEKMQKMEVDHKEIDRFLPAVYEQLEWMSREQLIKQFVSLEFSRFLDYYKNTPDLDRPEERQTPPRRPAKEGKRPVRSGRGVEHGYVRFQINLGFKDAITPRDLISLINRCARNKSIDIGKIQLGKTCSFFEVGKESESIILSIFKRVEYHGKSVSVRFASHSGGKKAVPRRRYSSTK